MKRISLISALVLGGSFLLAPVAKADQTLNLDFTGVAQANCLFTNLTSGRIVAKGRDLGTIGSKSGTTLGEVAGITPAAAGATVSCNSDTAFFVDTPVADPANSPLTLISTKSVLIGTGGTTANPVNVRVEAYTASPGTGLAGTSVRSDGFMTIGADSATTPVDVTVDMNAQAKGNVPVGVYKYTVLITAVPQ